MVRKLKLPSSLPFAGSHFEQYPLPVTIASFQPMEVPFYSTVTPSQYKVRPGSNLPYLPRQQLPYLQASMFGHLISSLYHQLSLHAAVDVKVAYFFSGIHVCHWLYGATKSNH